MLNDSYKTYTGQDTTAVPSQILKLGTHRGNRRIWLDHSEYLSAAGFLPGATYTAKYFPASSNTVLSDTGLIHLFLDQNGKTKVSKKTKGGKLHPVIDMNSKKIGAVFPVHVENIMVTYRNKEIFIEEAQ